MSLDSPGAERPNAFEKRLSLAREELRELVEDGEVPSGSLNEMHALAWLAAEDDDDDN